MKDLVFKREITLNMYEMFAQDVAKELGLKYGRYSESVEDINLPLIAVVVADFADNLRNELFKDYGINNYDPKEEVNENEG